MAYATQTDMEEVWGAQEVLTTFDRDADDAVDTAAIAEALDQASAEIDSYIGAAYDLPLSSTPKILTRYCSDMAIYIGSGPASTYTDEKRQRYEDARKWLQMVASGKATLGLEDEPTPRANGATFSASDRLFTRTTMRGL